MSTKLIALTLAVSMLGLSSVADARTSGGRHGGAHHVARSTGHLRHVSRLGRRTHRAHRIYAHRPVRINNHAYGVHRGYRHARRYNHGYVHNRVNWPRQAYTRYMNRNGRIPNPATTASRSNSITVPATITLPRSAV